MATVSAPPETFAELLKRLGNIAPDRIRTRPPPGTATPADVLNYRDSTPRRLCELVDGVLVEKAMGHYESRLAFFLAVYLGEYLRQNDIGTATGPDGPHELELDLIRYPDLAFISYDRIPPGADPMAPMPDWIPNLVVEILSLSNTVAEMARKRQEYFDAGVELVWIVDPRARQVMVYSSFSDCVNLTEDDMLDGASVLPGFRVPIREWFERAEKTHR